MDEKEKQRERNDAANVSSVPYELVDTVRHGTVRIDIVNRPSIWAILLAQLSDLDTRP
jgi:hypothetical protein